jgi:hypothetical protein
MASDEVRAELRRFQHAEMADASEALDTRFVHGSFEQVRSLHEGGQLVFAHKQQQSGALTRYSPFWA